MYDDDHRSRFASVPIATYSAEIHHANNDKRVVCTHIHNHHDFEILVIKTGKACFNIDGCCFGAEEGDVILVNPYEVHSSYTEKEFMPFSYYCITFDLSILAASPAHPITQMCQKLTDGYMKFNHLIKNNEIYNLILTIEEIFTHKDEGWEFYISSDMLRIFGLLYKDKSFVLTQNITRNYIFSKEVLKFIEKNFQNNITSADAAEKLCYDKCYFCRLFRKNFAQSFGDYLTFYRINHATELLHGGYSVSEAALSSGFNNLSYFTKKFKNQNKTLPSKIKGSEQQILN